MPTASINGVDLYYEERGQGFPLLCLPGGLGTGTTDFGSQMDVWAGRYQIIAPDFRGYGKSRPPNRNFAGNFFERDASDVIALTRALGCKSYFLAGWSDGANTAALIAAAESRRVRRLILWGGNSYLSAHDIERLERTRSLSSWPTGRLQELEAVYGESLGELWNAYCDSMRDLYSAGGDICRERLREIRSPTLILHGEFDPLISKQHPLVFQEGISGAELHLIRGGRHNIHLTHVDEFNDVMLRFLSE
jgi:valacyclovir hydrolase